jgi:hypothetical protein
VVYAAAEAGLTRIDAWNDARNQWSSRSPGAWSRAASADLVLDQQKESQPTAADVPVILRLIRHLAEYEPQPQEVKAIGPQLREALSGPDPRAFGVTASTWMTSTCGQSFVVLNIVPARSLVSPASDHCA